MKLLRILLLCIPMAVPVAMAAQLVDPEPMSVPAGLDEAAVANAIRLGLGQARWKPESEEPGRIIGMYRNKLHIARVGIRYDRDQVKIAYLDSSSLGYEESGGVRNIHRAYNGWVAQLSGKIQSELGRDNLDTVDVAAAINDMPPRSGIKRMPVQDVLDSAEAQGPLDGTVQFHFAGQPRPEVLEQLGTQATNRVTSAAGRSDEEACRWAMLAALKDLQAEAKKQGANAVVDIHSNYRGWVYNSPTQYECHSGMVNAKLTIRGTIAKVREP
ncbi:hypothetical protein D0B54_11545 [Solimonas sp. K1W22B-7]|uniref:hypothetical protein n=1 Tax=Solimonas sp. K1W22B-7 TaxID=2303331 RepID=UPI000E32F002|nr:hypothetical protein [Solimonas sp. K1W22B-7]AXQ29284.1 hypothetical protein D0B54_11545 [Solimonas sp. K1W22B-7]